MRGYFREIRACAIWDVANCDKVYDILLGDNIDYHSKVRIWNDSNPNHIVTVHDSGGLLLVFVIRHQCCWIATHCLSKFDCRVGTRVWWHTKLQARDGESCDCWSLRLGDNASLCCSWNPTSSSAKTSYLHRPRVGYYMPIQYIYMCVFLLSFT